MNSIIRAVIVDDEPDNISVLKLLLNKYLPQVSVLATFTDSLEALNFLRDEETDICFLDIEMPRLNGFDLLTALGKFKFKTIFVTAYDDFGIKAVKYQIFDYLLKPVDVDDLKACIKRYEDQVESNLIQNDATVWTNKNDKILLPVGQEYEFVQLDEIIRCESDDNYTTLYLDESRSILVSKTLKFIEDQLPVQQFLRVHNKHLINITKIKKYVKSDGGYFILTDGASVPLSRYRKDEVLRILGLRD